MPAPFDFVRGMVPRRSAFNLSHEKKFTCDLAQLIPVLVMEAVPGDHFQIGIELVIRQMPTLAPLLHEISAFVHYFFVPNRLIFPNPGGWEDFITGGVNGTDSTVLPTWVPTGGNVTNDDGNVVADNGVGSLWDFMGFPVGVIPAGAYPVSFPRRAYNLVWNIYYKDETQDADNALDSSIVMQRRWEKDFFTSALPWQQRGTPPSLPVVGSAVWTTGNFVNEAVQAAVGVRNTASNPQIEVGNANGITNLLNAFNANTLTNMTFNINDLRLTIQTQKWLERGARGGYRYIEQLKNHFGVSPRDERLQRPEYIGGCRMPLIMSEVLQTSASGLTGGSTYQGNMAGHGLSAGRDMCAKYTAPEYGIIIGILSVMPRTVYHQGISRTWLKTTRYDYYWPEFAHLSEQAVRQAEVYADGVSGDNLTVFGYQGRYNEMRYIPSQTLSLMHYGVTGSLAFWHLGRHFGSAPGLNSAFMKAVPRKDYLAVVSQPALLVNCANLVKAVRPLPIEADPGLMDHF